MQLIHRVSIPTISQLKQQVDHIWLASFQSELTDTQVRGANLKHGPFMSRSAELNLFTTIGEEFLRSLSRSTRELLALITALREAYRARWERTLIQWSDVWTVAGCPTPKLVTAGEWLKQSLVGSRPTAVLMLDALCYDVGAMLAATINSQEGTERAGLHAARAPLPSITALGMGMALPLDERDLHANLVDGHWHLRDNNTQFDLSIAEKRRAWLRARGVVPDDGILALNDVVRGEVPQPTKERKAVFITDNFIDQLGHDDELELFGSGPALERYRTAVTIAILSDL